jgi:hypothetical protein
VANRIYNIRGFEPGGPTCAAITATVIGFITTPMG